MINAKPGQKSDVKKVAPYPIKMAIIVTEGQPGVPGHIVKLNEAGFLAKFMADMHFNLGDTFKVNFELPVVKAKISATAKVVKTYLGLEAVQGNPTKVYTVEMHFSGLTRRELTDIGVYLSKSGQKSVFVRSA